MMAPAGKVDELVEGERKRVDEGSCQLQVVHCALWLVGVRLSE